MHQFVSYLRVNTDRQGKSSLGPEAQRAAAVTDLSGGAWTLLDEMVEVESGKATAHRLQLACAMALCQLTGAPLRIDKLDRLSRDAHFLIGPVKARSVLTANNLRRLARTFTRVAGSGVLMYHGGLSWWAWDRA